MNSPVATSIATVPLPVDAGAVYDNGSPSGSLAFIVPATTPVMASGTPTVGDPTTGRVGRGGGQRADHHRDGDVGRPPLPSVTVTVKLSAFSASVAPTLAAFSRALTVGA